MARKYRFFFHYRKQTGEMSLHFKNNCFQVKRIVCEVPCETKYNKTQPYLVMQGFCEEIIFDQSINKDFVLIK